MRFVVCGLKVLLISLVFSSSCFAKNIWSIYELRNSGQPGISIAAVIYTEEGQNRDVRTRFQLGGAATTAAGDTVLWGYFYVDPNDVSWGNLNNPDLYVKLWLDHTGTIYVNYFHVSVPDIRVSTDVLDQYGNTVSGSDVYSTATTYNRYVQHVAYKGSGGFKEAQ